MLEWRYLPMRLTQNLAWLVTLAAFTFSTSAMAAPADKEQARAAYDRGVEAHKRGDMHKAAEEFALADSFAPAAVALRAALDAAIEADDPPLMAELVERSKRETQPRDVATRVKEANAKIKGRAGRVHIVCPKGSSCLARIDEHPAEIDKVVWAHTGQRTVIVQVDGEPQTKLIEVGPDQVVEVAPTKGAPAAEPSHEEHSTGMVAAPSEGSRLSRGLPPIYFYAGVGLTTVLAGMTAVFALGASSKHGDFEDAGCTKAAYASCAQLKSDGEGAQTRTNVGLVLTLLSGAATTVVGVKFTDWRAPLLGLYPGGGVVGWRGTF